MTISLRIQVSLPQMMGQMLRFYGPMLLPCMVMMLIMVLAFQMRRWVHGCMYPPSCSYCTVWTPVNFRRIFSCPCLRRTIVVPLFEMNFFVPLIKKNYFSPLV